jgi:hypothetical protein
VAFALVALSATRTDPDIWGHVRFGLDWLHTYRLPSVDPYSFTQDRPWINHEWLSETLMAYAYRAGGASGLVILKMAVMYAALSALFWRMRHSTPIVAVSVGSLAIVGTLPISVTIRPQLWSVLGLTLVIVLVGDNRAPKLINVAATAALFVFWANLHGGWITGASVLAVYALVRIWKAPRQTGRWIALVIAAVLGTLLNPYGVGLWWFLATTVRASRPDITEWQPVGLASPVMIWVSVAVPVTIATVLARRRDTRPHFEDWAVLFLLVTAGLRVSRVAPLIVPATLALLAPKIDRAWGGAGELTVPLKSAAAVLALPCIAAFLAVYAPVAKAMQCLPIQAYWAPDRDAAARLAGASGRLWTTFDWGEYAIWHFGPQLRVSIDGRRETVYSDDVVQWHRAFERGDTEARARFEAVMPEYVWLRSDRTAARQWLTTHGYRLDVNTPASFIGVRSDLPELPSAAAPLPACFP